MFLEIYDENLTFLGVLEGYSSLRWIRKYHKSGRFEITCTLNKETLRLLKRGHIIYKTDGKEAGIIEYINLGFSNNTSLDRSNENIEVKGKFLTGLLDRRIVWGHRRFNRPAEAAMRILIDENAINPENPDRVLPRFVLGELQGWPNKIERQISYRNLLETVEEFALSSELGIRTVFDLDNEEYVFEVYEGINRADGNGVNPQAVFSRAFENVLSQYYVDSLDNYKNTILIAGQGEGEDRYVVAIEEGEGLHRYETYSDARDLQLEGRNYVVGGNETLGEDGESVSYPLLLDVTNFREKEMHISFYGRCLDFADNNKEVAMYFRGASPTWYFENFPLTTGWTKFTTTIEIPNDGPAYTELAFHFGAYNGTESLAGEVRNVTFSEVDLNEYEEMLLERGQARLDELVKVESFDSDVNLYGNLHYKKDFDLGDIVTCIDKNWGVKSDVRITEIQEIYEGDGESINVIFGQNVPTLAERVKIELKNGG